MVISEQEKNRILNLHINSININGSLITEEVYGKGQKGKKIKEIQKLLGNVTVDGRFGPETEKAVRQFQKSSGLKSDGYVGSETLKALQGKTSEGGTFDDNEKTLTTWKDYKADWEKYISSRDEGNIFRKWMKINYPDWEYKEQPLDLKGSHTNMYMLQAYVDHGKEFENSGFLEKYSSADEINMPSEVVGEFDTVEFSDSLSSNVSFNPKEETAVIQCDEDLGCAQWVSDMLNKWQGNAWHAHRIGTNTFSTFENLDTNTVKDMTEYFNKVNANPETNINSNLSSFVGNLVPDQSNFSDLNVDDVVGLYHKPSGEFTRAFYEGLTGNKGMGKGIKQSDGPFFVKEDGEAWSKEDIGKDIKFKAGKTLTSGKGPGINTHLGFVGAKVDGEPIIFHNVHGNVYATPLSKMGGDNSIVWARSTESTGSDATAMFNNVWEKIFG
jgi:hypothetical protein|tara:strand:+ start:327 stop:1649 length:1323 start_codon:yes stop_codon:yes gene_type:complete